MPHVFVLWNKDLYLWFWSMNRMFESLIPEFSSISCPFLKWLTSQLNQESKKKKNISPEKRNGLRKFQRHWWDQGYPLMWHIKQPMSLHRSSEWEALNPHWTERLSLCSMSVIANSVTLNTMPRLSQPQLSHVLARPCMITPTACDLREIIWESNDIRSLKVLKS